MKSVFMFFFPESSFASIVSGYTSKKAIEAAGLRTSSNVRKFDTVDEAKAEACRWADTVKVHIK